MDIVLKVSGEEALSLQAFLRHAQHSKAGLQALILRAARQAAAAQAKAELAEMDAAIERAYPSTDAVPTEGKNEEKE